MPTRAYNFSAGPAALPATVLEEARNALWNWNGHGASIIELGHRTDAITDMMTETEALFRSLLSVPSEYHMLFLGGAARTHFAMLPMNFLNEGAFASYLVTGIWSQIALQECQKIAQAEGHMADKNQNFTYIPDWDPRNIAPESRYLFYTSNETVNGVQFFDIPDSAQLPLVCDMTSSLLSEPVDVQRFGLIFAGAQKNIANAGLTLVIVADRFLQEIKNHPGLPTMLDYRTHVNNHSLYATPPVFNCYIANRMALWVQGQGGVSAMRSINQRKAAKLYDFIDNSRLYYCKVEPQCRSRMNVCFYLGKPELEMDFLKQAEKTGLLALKGHRTMGGMRASLYNAMPEEGVDALITFMQRFEKVNR